MTAFKTAAAAVAISLLAACGGGGGGGGNSSNEGPSGPNPGPVLDQIRSLTEAAPPAETAADQDARSPSIVSRADSLLLSNVYAHTSSSDLPTFRLRASCSGTVCRLEERRLGYYDTISLSDLGIVSGNEQPVGTKHGVTLIRDTGQHEGVDYRSLGAWMQNAGFSVQVDRETVEGVQINSRIGIVAGDLTGSPPAGGATWQGLMVGTPAEGTGRGDRLQGDATLTYSLADQTMGATFTNIQNIDRLRAHSVSTVSFTDVLVKANGEFQAGLTGNHIQGGFYGPGHAEVAGIFEQQNIVGAFGAKR